MAMAKSKACPKKNMAKVMEFLRSVQWNCNIVIFIDTHADANTGHLQHQGGSEKRSASVQKVSALNIYIDITKTNLFPDPTGLSWAGIYGRAQNLAEAEASDHPVLRPLDD
jgi:hypothetical protein